MKKFSGLSKNFRINLLGECGEKIGPGYLYLNLKPTLRIWHKSKIRENLLVRFYLRGQSYTPFIYLENLVNNKEETVA